MDDKKKIRNKMLSVRENMKKRTVNSVSNNVCRMIMELDEYKNAETVFVYMAFRNEIALDTLINDCLEKNKKVYVPVIVGDKMFAADYSKDTCQGPFGTTEPIEKNIFEGTCDLSIIPSTACDLLGGRLGFGAGYYDKYLEGRNTCKLAPIYDFQLIDELPLEPHDILMDIVVRPGGILRF